MYSHTSATIVKKEIFNKCGGFKSGMRINEDFALFYSIALVSNVIYSGFPLSCYYGKIEGQSTSDRSRVKENLRCQISRINHTYSVWDQTKIKNKLFIIFLKYEIRHILICHLRNNDYDSISLTYSNLDKTVLHVFNRYEIRMISNKYLTKISKIYLLFTKIIWRLHGFPRT